ncbi:MAG TPA: hypothetical protein VMX17_13755 [Candidatus Glassbacteria bacterium]|nr:hypothetical protein [Candidatus Glassbacteria bacterium]
MPTLKDILDSATIDKIIYSWRNKRTYLGDETQEHHISNKRSRTVEKIFSEFLDNKERVGSFPHQLTREVRHERIEGDVQHQEIGGEIGPSDE